MYTFSLYYKHTHIYSTWVLCTHIYTCTNTHLNVKALISWYSSSLFLSSLCVLLIPNSLHWTYTSFLVRKKKLSRNNRTIFTVVHFFESLVFARGTEFLCVIMFIFVVQTLNFVSRNLETRPHLCWSAVTLASLGPSLLIIKKGGLEETDDPWGTSLESVGCVSPK